MKPCQQRLLELLRRTASGRSMPNAPLDRLQLSLWKKVAAMRVQLLQQRGRRQQRRVPSRRTPRSLLLPPRVLWPPGGKVGEIGQRGRLARQQQQRQGQLARTFRMSFKQPASPPELHVRVVAVLPRWPAKQPHLRLRQQAGGTAFAQLRRARLRLPLLCKQETVRLRRRR